MLTELVRLRGALQAAALPLDLPGVAPLRDHRQQVIDQLEDYVIPRLMSLDAPLLTVVGGSTGAGKSTLVNSLVGHRVTAPGVLRPTTRSPVLAHHPKDGRWFGQDRLLPDLRRVDHPTDDPHCIQLVPTTAVPQGLAILDAPDVDSVEERNRVLAGQLLAAADLWLFVTSAARYSDQVPWEYLKQAAERSTAVAIVLDRTPPDAVATVSAHLARMLASRGLKDSPLFGVAEGPGRRRRPAPVRARRRDPRVARGTRRRPGGARRHRLPDRRRRHPDAHPAHLPDRRRRDRPARRPR
ncbi:dynamin family protein [Nocardioides sp. TF02-7]|uniref:dynamin family protein n=1 Tax=Nocardioides sp. TF02-7 TaxID=2917724 RepID=UPI001F05F068|nr:dynamin family protein [Nocardioides sp. TF02-7]UMG91688.1 dynamin family protein [Nocardioides sp. TF02-7]